MTKDEIGNPVTGEDREFEAEVQRAMRAAGTRDELAHGELSPADFQMHHDAALMVWQRQQRRRRRRRAWGGIAVAAAVALGLVFAGSWLDRTSSTPQVTIAESFAVTQVQGDVEVLVSGDDGQAWQPASAFQPIAMGSRVRTGAGAAVIRSSAPEGPELRLDGGTELMLEGSSRATLMRGRVYVDTGEHGSPPGDGAAQPRMLVSTALGDAVDLGTQFEVRVGEASLGVRVRAGRVEVRPQDDLEGLPSDLVVDSGSGVEVFADGRVERSEIDVTDGTWDWSGRLAAPFELDGATLAAYLDWLRRETGWTVRFESAAARTEAETVQLTGSSTAGLLPAETVELVLPSAGYVAERTADGLAIRPIP